MYFFFHILEKTLPEIAISFFVTFSFLFWSEKWHIFESHKLIGKVWVNICGIPT